VIFPDIQLILQRRKEKKKQKTVIAVFYSVANVQQNTAQISSRN